MKAEVLVKADSINTNVSVWYIVYWSKGEEVMDAHTSIFPPAAGTWQKQSTRPVKAVMVSSK